MKIFLSALVLFFSAITYAGGKAMDCTECRSHYPDLSACYPICGGGKVEGMKAKKLYAFFADLGASDCGAGKCVADLTKVTCTWANDPKVSKPECSYLDSDKKSGKIQGKRADELVKLILAIRKVPTDCGQGTCGFSTSQDINCAESKNIGETPLKLSYSCSVAEEVSETTPLQKQESSPGSTEGFSKKGTF